MGYHLMSLDGESHKIFMMVFPFSMFECLVLPQCITSVMDIFQVRMVAIIAGMWDKASISYLNDILHT